MLVLHMCLVRNFEHEELVVNSGENNLDASLLVRRRKDKKILH